MQYAEAIKLLESPPVTSQSTDPKPLKTPVSRAKSTLSRVSTLDESRPYLDQSFNRPFKDISKRAPWFISDLDAVNLRLEVDLRDTIQVLLSLNVDARLLMQVKIGFLRADPLSTGVLSKERFQRLFAN